MTDKTRNEEKESVVHAFPARILLAERSITLGTDDTALLALARERAPDPTVFDVSPPFFWPAEISNSRLDSYFSRMQPSSLKNYAQDADAGVSFQNSHNSRELGLGYSLKGRYVGPGGNGIAKTLAAFYTIPGLKLGQTDTTNFIVGVRSGICRDVSIGFFGGRSVCSICARDMRDYAQCQHWAGEVYPVTDSAGKVTGQVMAEELIEDAHMSEVSCVYDGACPGAAITKARWAAEAGVLLPSYARVLESRYRIKLPGSHRAWPGVGPGESKQIIELEEIEVSMSDVASSYCYGDSIN